MIALLRMFATGVSFTYGLAVSSVIAVLVTLGATLTLLPAILSRFRARLVRPRRGPRGVIRARRGSAWRRWSETVRARPVALALVSLTVVVAMVLPAFALRLDISGAGNDPANLRSHQAFDLLAGGFGAGFSGPLALVAELRGRVRPSVRSVAIRVPLEISPDIDQNATSPTMYHQGAGSPAPPDPASGPRAAAMSAHVQPELVDQLIELYCDWRSQCWVVRSSYEQFTAAAAEDWALAYAAYRAALDREEAATDAYAEQLTLVAFRASTDSRRTSLLA